MGENINGVEKCSQEKNTNKIESLRTEMEHLQNENEQKRKMLDEIHKENCMLEENVMKHEEDEISLNG